MATNLRSEGTLVTLAELNAASEKRAAELFSRCCAAKRWISLMVADRPYDSLNTCLAIAKKNWEKMNTADYLEAFEGHPKIGDLSSLRAKYQATQSLATGEQSAVQCADEETLHRLAEGNAQYEQKNGFIFIVFATGKSALEMLTLLEARLLNSRDEELIIAANEQSKITELRIKKLIQSTH